MENWSTSQEAAGKKWLLDAALVYLLQNGDALKHVPVLVYGILQYESEKPAEEFSKPSLYMQFASDYF